jgi:hypothetical protein
VGDLELDPQWRFLRDRLHGVIAHSGAKDDKTLATYLAEVVVELGWQPE